MNTFRKDKGFTIIEVVLVLAIAGLIFLMVFIALPALQASQRDTARKNDVSIVSAGVTSYTSNNRGTFPSTAQLSNYVKNVSDNTTSVSVAGNAGAQTVTPQDGQVIVVKGTKCGAANGGSMPVVAGTSRQFTVVTKLEGGNGSAYCLDN